MLPQSLGDGYVWSHQKIDVFFLPKKQALGKKEIFEKFKRLGSSRCTLYSRLEKLLKNRLIERKKGSVRVAKKVTAKEG